ncbi:sulfate transporter family-domain-containing protein [Hyaloraphidium curvatum]|nr:sulfate transporter family-domain-containing protein [Hyaloraphidium curvatum]
MASTDRGERARLLGAGGPGGYGADADAPTPSPGDDRAYVEFPTFADDASLDPAQPAGWCGGLGGDAEFRARLRYYVPVLRWLPSVTPGTLLADVLAGVTVGFYMLPGCLGYSQTILKVPVAYGLYTGLWPLLIYAVLGTSRHLSVGPEAVVALLTGSAINEFVGDVDVVSSPEEEAALRVSTMATLTLLVGLFTSVLGFFRLGFLDSVLSRSLLRGFISAVAVVVVIEQLPLLLGIDYAKIPKAGHGSHADVIAPAELTPIEKLARLIRHLPYTHGLTALIALVTVSFLSVARVVKTQARHIRIINLFPDILCALLLADGLSYLFDWEEHGVRVVGPVRAGLVLPAFPSLAVNRIKSLFLSAVLISIIGFVESVAVTSRYSSMYNYPVSPNRELVALGVSNTLSSFLGSWPAFGSLPRSGVADRAGAKTQIFAVVAAVVVLITALFFSPLLEYIPTAVLAGVIAVASVGLLELDEIGFMMRLGAWSDLALMALTFGATVILGIELGTLISVALSLLLVIRETTQIRLSIVGRVRVADPVAPGGPARHGAGGSVQDEDKAETVPGILIVRVEEDLFFGNCGQLRERMRRIETYGTLDVHPGSEPPPLRETSAVVLDLEGAFSCDASAARTLHEMVHAYMQRGIAVCLVHLRAEVRDVLMRSGTWDLVVDSGGGVYERTRDAVAEMEERAAARMPIPQSPETPTSFGGARQRPARVPSLSVDAGEDRDD